eukprot:310357_1
MHKLYRNTYSKMIRGYPALLLWHITTSDEFWWNTEAQDLFKIINEPVPLRRIRLFQYIQNRSDERAELNAIEHDNINGYDHHPYLESQLRDINIEDYIDKHLWICDCRRTSTQFMWRLTEPRKYNHFLAWNMGSIVWRFLELTPAMVRVDYGEQFRRDYALIEHKIITREQFPLYMEWEINTLAIKEELMQSTNTLAIRQCGGQEL